MIVGNAMIEIRIQLFVLHLGVIDLIGSAPIFFVVTKNLNLNRKVKTAFNSIIIAFFFVFIFFAVLGNYIFKSFEYNFFCSKISEWYNLFLVSLEMLFNKRREQKEEHSNFDSPVI